MPPDALNPFVLLAWLIGTPTALTITVLGVKAIVFIANATRELKQIPTIAKHVADLRHGQVNDAHAIDLTLTLMVADINELQREVNLNERRYPERRLGPPDRRQA